MRNRQIRLSRETVTRVFADFRKLRLIQQNGSTLVIPNRVALKSLITHSSFMSEQ